MRDILIVALILIAGVLLIALVTMQPQTINCDEFKVQYEVGSDGRQYART